MLSGGVICGRILFFLSILKNMYLHFHQQQEKKEDKNAGLTNMKGKESDLSGEISNNISSVASPKGNDTFILNSSGKAVSNSLV